VQFTKNKKREKIKDGKRIRLQILTRSFKTKPCYRAKMFVSLQCQKEDDFFAA
jgi:hypothetical protein